jgi:hypothetical protein
MIIVILYIIGALRILVENMNANDCSSLRIILDPLLWPFYTILLFLGIVK